MINASCFFRGFIPVLGDGRVDYLLSFFVEFYEILQICEIAETKFFIYAFNYFFQFRIIAICF